MALSDLVVRQAKAAGKAYTLPDIDGLSLAVSPAGNKSWHFRYYWLGKQQRMSLGNYPRPVMCRSKYNLSVEVVMVNLLKNRWRRHTRPKAGKVWNPRVG